jgi:GntR family transcriptional regulator
MDKHIPRYLRVYTSLRNQIENLEYKVGELLPPEPELERLFDVSRTTVRKAVELLANQGFVHIQQGKGTSILDYKATQRLQYVTSFSETLREQGFEVEHKVLSVQRKSASSRTALMLKITEGAELVQIERVAYANRKPIAIMLNHLIPEIVNGIEERAGKIGSLYHFLENEYNIFIDAATDYITAKVAEEREAELLEVETGEPLLIVRRISYRNSRAIESATLKILATKYEYAVHTKERPPRKIGGSI